MDINKYPYKSRLKSKDIIGASNLSEADIYEILYAARLINKKKRAEEEYLFLKNKQIFTVTAGGGHMLALAPLKSAVYEAGGNIVRLNIESLGENVAYAARQLAGSGAAAVVFAGFNDEFLEEFSGFSPVPVINAQSRDCSPIQALTGLYTLWQLKSQLDGLKLFFAANGRSENINSLLIAAVKAGCEAQVLVPPDKILERASNKAMQYGDYHLTDSTAGAADADAVYIDFKQGEFDRAAVSELLSKVQSGAAVLCPSPENMPNGEDVFEGKDHAILKQISNMVYIYKAILSLLI